MPALRFKTCRLLPGNVRNRELSLIQRRILRRLRNKRRSIKRNLSQRENLNSNIKSQTTRKLSIYYGDLPIREMHRGRERTSYIPFLLNQETRSDVIPVRLHFSDTLPQARQPISHRRTLFSAGLPTSFSLARRCMHSNTNELLLAVAPYVPNLAEQMVETAGTYIPQITEAATLGPDVNSVAETSHTLQEETLLSTSPVLLDPHPPGNIGPIAEFSVCKITNNLITNLDTHPLNLEEIISHSKEIFELKKSILAKLRTLASAEQANGPFLWNSPGADDVITHLDGSEYKLSYLRRISKSLLRNGTSSIHYTDFLSRRMKNLNLTDPA